MISEGATDLLLGRIFMTVAESADAEWISACQDEKSRLLLTLYVKRCDATPLRFSRHQGREPGFKDASSDPGGA